MCFLDSGSWTDIFGQRLFLLLTTPALNMNLELGTWAIIDRSIVLLIWESAVALEICHERRDSLFSNFLYYCFTWSLRCKTGKFMNSMKVANELRQTLNQASPKANRSGIVEASLHKICIESGRMRHVDNTSSWGEHRVLMKQKLILN